MLKGADVKVYQHTQPPFYNVFMYCEVDFLYAFHPTP
jgi:hypothetical protein